jgi:sulfite reductase (NADPH) flavoprotein alpha-component
MAKDIETTLTDIVAEHGDPTAADAAKFIAELKASGRYQGDVY